MGWSQPSVSLKTRAWPWSPWICLLIIFIGVLFGIIHIVLHSPAGEMPSLASGFWLPLTLKIVTGILIGITVYSLWWEIQAVRVWIWNAWCRDMDSQWRAQAQQHLFVIKHTILTSDPLLLPQLAGVAQERDQDSSALTVLPGEPLVPGISRFEQLCRELIQRVKDALLKRYPSGHLTVLIQTSGSEREREILTFNRLWSDEKLPWIPNIHFLNEGEFFNEWNQAVSSSRVPVIVLALHYRQPDESQPELASVLMLAADSLLAAGEKKTAIRLFRAMPLNSRALSYELKELRDVAKSEHSQKHLVWHSGIPDAARQGMGRILSELSIIVYSDMGINGVIDFDNQCGKYPGLAGWLMIAAASEMTFYGASNQWILCENEKESWAITLGNNSLSIDEESGSYSLPPFPAGSVLLSLLINSAIFWFIDNTSSLGFSWAGIMLMLFSLIVTLPGIPFLLRRIVVKIQRTYFVKTALQSGKE